MAADFGEGHFDRPTTDKPAEDVERVGIKIGAEKGLRFEFAHWIAHQDITDGNAVTGVVPYSGAGDDLDHPFAAAVPPGHQQTAPSCFSAGKALLEAGKAFADDGRPTDLTGQSPWRQFVERSIEPQAGDHGEPWSHVVEQVDRGEAGIADADDAAVRQPQRRLDQYLPGPVGKLLVLPLSLFMLIPIALRGGQDGQQGDSVLKSLDKLGLATRPPPDSRCCANRLEGVADVVGGWRGW